MPEPIWHHHSIGEFPVHCHAHPGDFPGHEHRGYALVQEIGQPPRLVWHGFGHAHLPGEVTPGEVLLIDGTVPTNPRATSSKLVGGTELNDGDPHA